MMTQSKTFKLAVVALAAGLATSASAQPRNDPDKTLTGQSSTSQRGAWEFRSCHWLSGRSVVNDKGDTIAEVSDLIVDRGSGRVEYAVIKAGSVLGIGGKTLAIPYGALGWDAAKEHYQFNTTADHLKQYPEFTAESWSAMMESKPKSKGSVLRDRLSEEGPWMVDPYAGSLSDAKTVTVEGEITKVERVRTSNGSEHVVVTVNAKDATTRRIALGPSWYISGGALSPVRGDRVTIDALELARDPHQTFVATRIVRDGQERRLRETDSLPRWSGKTVEHDGKTFDAPYWRYLLMSNLRGQRVDCRGTECGKVNDVIVERGTGECAFLSIDPNENFLGIADTKRLVPWPIVTIALDGVVRVDASKDMILASPETPKSVDELNARARTDAVYKAFEVPAPAFERNGDRTAAAPPSNSDAWSAKGPICAAIDSGSARTLEGTVTDIGQVEILGGVPPARSITLKSGDQSYEVLIGPRWYMENQRLGYQVGDSVKVEACRTNVDGKSYWIAQSVSRNGTKMVLIDNGRPTWDDR